MTKPILDQRRHERRKLKVEIHVGDGSAGGELCFDSRDVSEGGVFLRSDLLLEVGETFFLTFVLPGAEVALRTRGRVTWVNRDSQIGPDDPPGMGVQFLDLSAAEREALRAALE
ncbi:MAG: hypothetical protein GYA21_02830 [Myxococcales bacterium]|nr:hypothetical protein [Myxococcales bacterium]